MCASRRVDSETLFCARETNSKIWITTMTTSNYLKPLATLGDLESRAVLKATVKARESSEIENIVTTQDELRTI